MRKGILLFLFISGITIHLQAQQSQTITLQEAIDLALENSIVLEQSTNNLRAAEVDEFGAKANFLPSLNASFGGSQNVGRQFIESELRFGEETTNSLRGSLNTQVPIFEGFSNILNLRSSRANRELEQNSMERTRETVIFNAASGFLQVLLDQQLLGIAEEDLEASRQQLEQVEAQVEVGSRPTVDLYDQESLVANNELAVIEQENALEISKTRLIRTLQLDPFVDYEFEMPEIGVEDVSPEEYNLQDLTERALTSRKDLRVQELQIDIFQNTLKEAQFALYPSISAEAGISTSYQDVYRTVDPNNPNDRVAVDFGDQFFDQRIQRFAGFSVSIPIFNNWNQRMNIQQAQVNYKNAMLDLIDEEYAVREEVRQAYSDYTSYAKRLEASQTALRAAERSYETQQQRYEVGSSTLIELTDANARYVEAQSNLANALYNLIFQEKLLEYYLGSLDESITFQ